jgi:hypothetical protein
MEDPVERARQEACRHRYVQQNTFACCDEPWIAVDIDK